MRRPVRAEGAARKRAGLFPEGQPRRKIAPSEYRLSQTADMVCTLELMREKSENGAGMSKSELIFFESRRRLSKVFLKTLKGLEFPKS